MQNKKLAWRQILIFLAFAFGVAWLVGLVIYWTGGLGGGALLAGEINLRATLLLALGYMPAPAVAHLLTRWLTGEGWHGLDMRLHLRRNWRWLLMAWLVVPPVMTVVGATLFYLLFPAAFDPTMRQVTQLVQQLGGNSGNAASLEQVPAWVIVVGQLVSGLLLGGVLNAPFTFGEEFGWRGYLQAKLLPLGWRRATLWLGVIWGVWHWPIIALGHNYGREYAGAPWLGMLAMVWFCITVGIFLSWVQLRSGSVWPAVLGHAAINAISAAGILFLQGRPQPLLGPAPTGLIAGLGWTALAVWLWWRGGTLVNEPQVVEQVTESQGAYEPNLSRAG